jgi:hypothetical protein
MFTELKKNIDESLSNNNKGNLGFNDDDFNNLLNDVNNLRKEFDGYRDDTNNNLKFLNNALNMKADK